MKPAAPEKTLYPTLDPETYHDARTVAPGYDVYYLEQEWRNFWVESGKPELKNPDAAFIGFCKSRHPFGMPNCSNASAHPARGTAKAFTSSFRTSPSCSAT